MSAGHCEDGLGRSRDARTGNADRDASSPEIRLCVASCAGSLCGNLFCVFSPSKCDRRDDTFFCILSMRHVIEFQRWPHTIEAPSVLWFSCFSMTFSHPVVLLRCISLT